METFIDIVLVFFILMVVFGMIGMFWTPKKPKELIEKENENPS